VTETLLDRLPEDGRKALIKVMARRTFARNEMVFHEGAPGDTMHLITRGRFVARVTNLNGDEVALSVMGPGEVFGEMMLIRGVSHIRSASVVAIGSGQTLSISKRELEGLRQKNRAVDQFVIDVLGERVKNLTTALLDAHHADAELRVHRCLNRLRTTFDDGSDGPVEIPLTQSDLASVAGTTRQTMNQTLRSAEDAGVVELRRGRVIIVDPDRLEDLAWS
jgi:CRP-like cAMP-binding protein